MIELANVSNEDAAVAMARLMHAESAMSRLPFSENKVRARIRHPNAFCAMYRRGGEYIGGILGSLGQPYYTDAIVASDDAIFIKQEHRGNGIIVVRLIRAFEKWAIERGAAEVYLGVSTGINPDVALGLYAKLGYEPVGGMTKRSLLCVAA